ncbi:hypothetical protein R2083_08265 [Nitrosomonas sp. Is35]|uniref:hypothetical protein n=1 Tax=Nitrosomonas sp. Is35 TaxID=3080534 RepID=UPI00294B8D6C|nr:hypothetical protein [Nitrosomonas sp. Is35]MDV6347507.1 hypothetical protein [Nitrosomonas sp. Is35]
MQINNIRAFFSRLRKKHKHHELIEAKKRDPSLQIQWELNDQWIDIENPVWFENQKYRAKERPKTLKFRRYLDIDGNIRLVAIDASQRSDFVRWLGNWEEMDIEGERHE